MVLQKKVMANSGLRKINLQWQRWCEFQVMITTVFSNLDLTAAFKDPDNFPYIISNDATENRLL